MAMYLYGNVMMSLVHINAHISLIFVQQITQTENAGVDAGLWKRHQGEVYQDHDENQQRL